MITEQDLQEAIAECEGERNPNANTCIKLAAFYTIKEHMYGKPPETYSYAAEPPQERSVESSGIQYDSGTEFTQSVHGRDAEEIMPIFDELMTTLQIVQPRLYAGVIRKLNNE